MLQYNDKEILSMSKIIVLLIACFSLLHTSATFAAKTETIEYLNSGKILPTGLPFSEAVRVGNTLYLSGQIGILPRTTTLIAGGIKAESQQTMQNIKATLETHGYQMSDLVKCTVMLADIKEWAAFNEVYKTFFTDHFPARSALGVSGLAYGARVEVECLAVK
jgi:2-iminobutanoate/2-iminopropanoate deaminase